MNDQSERDSEREQVELLLPWYANGTLSPAETERVEAYLARHPEMEPQLATLREDHSASVAANEAIAVSSEAAMDRLMRAIDAEAPVPHKTPSFASRLSTVLDDYLRSLSPDGLSWAAVAAAVVIVVQAALLGALLWQQPADEAVYRTASGRQAATGVEVLIQFNGDAGLDRVGRFLAEHDAQIVAGPKPGGFYLVRVVAQNTDEAAYQTLIARLASDKGVVKLVLPTQ